MSTAEIIFLVLALVPTFFSVMFRRPIPLSGGMLTSFCMASFVVSMMQSHNGIARPAKRMEPGTIHQVRGIVINDDTQHALLRGPTGNVVFYDLPVTEDGRWLTRGECIVATRTKTSVTISRIACEASED